MLSASNFGQLRRLVAASDYRSVHTQKWDKVWRLWDGAPQRGQSIYFDPDGVFGWKGATYPTATAMDLLIDEVRRMSALHPDITGVEGVDWLGLYLCPWLYPVGSALSLHQDAHNYTGSFTFFVHARWSVHWGGELLVYPSMSAWANPVGLLGAGTSGIVGDEEPWISDDGDADGSGIATAVSPRPNRLVLLGESRPHRVARVDQNAGAHVRASISGFFLRAP